MSSPSRRGPSGHGPFDPLRRRYLAYIGRHRLGWDVVVAALTVIWVAIPVIQRIVGYHHPVLNALDTLLWLLFTLEFLSRFLASEARAAYVRGQWFDAAAIVPQLRFVKLLRVAQLLRLIRSLRDYLHAGRRYERLFERKDLLLLVAFWLLVWMVCSLGLYVAEVNDNPAINSFGDASWWGIVTVATVGYGDVYPITSEGRFIGALLMLLGVTTFAALSGTIAGALINPAGREVRRQTEPDLVASLRALRAAGALTEEEVRMAMARLADQINGDGLPADQPPSASQP